MPLSTLDDNKSYVIDSQLYEIVLFRFYISSHVYPAQRDRCLHLKVIFGVRWDLVTPTPNEFVY